MQIRKKDLQKMIDESIQLKLNESNREFKIDDVASIIQNYLKTIGLNIRINSNKIVPSSEVMNIYSGKIKNFGEMFPVFKSAILNINVLVSEENQFITLFLDYSWKHYRGRNGYTATRTYRDNAWEIRD